MNTHLISLSVLTSRSPGVLMQEEGEAGTGSQEGSRHGLERRRSTPLLLHYAPLDFMEALSEGCAFNGQAITLADSELTARVHYLSPVKTCLRTAAVKSAAKKDLHCPVSRCG